MRARVLRSDRLVREFKNAIILQNLGADLASFLAGSMDLALRGEASLFLELPGKAQIVATATARSASLVVADKHGRPLPREFRLRDRRNRDIFLV